MSTPSPPMRSTRYTCSRTSPARAWYTPCGPDTIAVRKPARAKASAAPAPDLSAGDAPLFEALKAWRLGAAGDKPAFTVASNKTLTAIAAARPSDDDSLLAIKGVGPAFLDKYAPEVLAIVSEHPVATPVAVTRLAS